MWPHGRFGDATGSTPAQHVPIKSEDFPPSEPSELTGDLIDQKIKYWHGLGYSLGQPIGRGKMLEMFCKRDPDWEIAAISRQQVCPSMNDDNLFKSKEQIAAEQRRWKERFADLQSKEDHREQRGTMDWAVDNKGQSDSAFQLNNDDFPPLK